MYRGYTISFVLAPFLIANLAVAEPPKVISLEPADGATDVNPTLTELRVVFDQDMRRSGHSLCGGGSSFPKTRGMPTWKDARTLIIKVALESDREYQMSLNCASAQNFVSTKGETLTPTRWHFTTVANRRKPDQRRINAQSFEELSRIIQDHYSYRDRKKLDWNALERKYRSKTLASKSTSAWVKNVAKMLAPAQDPHLWLSFGDKPTATYQRKYQTNFNMKGVEAALGKLSQLNKNAYTAKTEDGIAYLLIPSWSGDLRAEIENLQDVLGEMSKSNGIIIDVRPNSGGDESLARTVAAWFVQGEKTYSKHANRDKDAKDGFGKTLERKITGNKASKRYAGPVAVLMGPTNLSSCESFLLMMKQGRQVKLIGQNSGGSSGNPKKFTLPNGVDIYVPSWKDLLPDGTLLEGRGVAPEIQVPSHPKDFEQGDPVIDRALKDLRIRMQK